MPLVKGTSNDAVNKNVRELRASGYGNTQAIAIALHVANKSEKPRTASTGKISK